jgi:hypothetical protein
LKRSRSPPTSRALPPPLPRKRISSVTFSLQVRSDVYDESRLSW